MAIPQAAGKSPAREEEMEKRAQLKIGLRFGIGSFPSLSQDRVLTKALEIRECHS